MAAHATARARIVAALRRRGTPMTAVALREATGMSASGVDTALRFGIKRGALHVAGPAVRGRAYWIASGAAPPVRPRPAATWLSGLAAL